jgi:hypothetical protein
MEYFLGGVIATRLLLNMTEKKPDILARATVCNTMLMHFGEERMSHASYNFCLEYGAEETVKFKKIILTETVKINPVPKIE